jgi:hypothetical protein
MEVCRIPMEELYPVLDAQLQRGEAQLPVTGISMTPTLRGGRDLVRLRKLEDRPKRGDILLYRRDNGQYILHRALRGGNGVVCCGDRQFEKEPVRTEQILAVVTAFCRKGKWHSTSAPFYRLYVFFWMILPLRRCAFFLRRAWRRR